MLDEIRHCILATDLALFFDNRPKLQRIVDHQEFDWNNKEHLWVDFFITRRKQKHQHQQMISKKERNSSNLPLLSPIRLIYFLIGFLLHFPFVANRVCLVIVLLSFAISHLACEDSALSSELPLIHSQAWFYFQSISLFISLSSLSSLLRFSFYLYRLFVMGLCMTAADLCSSYKQWEVQRSNVSIIMEEFFQQVIEHIYIFCFLSCFFFFSLSLSCYSS